MLLHPAEVALIKYIRELGFGQIERIKVKDGLPCDAEKVTEQAKFL
jgi:hypothetical protein